jgi:DNA-binding transcriptional LysR family regulator
MDLLRSLGTFVRVAEAGSLSAVAREAGTSHAATSRIISQLEDHFGVRLLHRTTRRLSLTEDGQDLLSHARQLLATQEEMEAALGRQNASPTGRVRVGVPATTATLIVPRLPDLLQKYPGLLVELVVGDRFDDLVEARLDLALLRGRPPEGSVIARAIGTFSRVLVAGPTYLERRGAPQHPNDLADHECIIHETGADSARWTFATSDGPVDVQVSGSFHADNSEVVHRAALAGLGVAMMREPQVADDLRAARLYQVLPGFASGQDQLFLVFPSKRHLAPRTRVMIEFLAAITQEVETRLRDARVWGENETTWLM